MNTFLNVFKFQVKQLFSVKNTIIILLLLILALLFVQYGVWDYNNRTLKQKGSFQEVEKIKLKQFQNWRQYGSYGFRMIALPAPISILFTNSVTLNNMNAYVDSGEMLRIYQSLKGENVFELRKKWLADFSGIILFFGSLLVLLYGYQSYCHKENLRFLSSISGKKELYASIFLSRAILLFLLLAFITACAHLLILINGIHVPFEKFLLLSFFDGYLTLLFFYVLGTVFSSFKSKIVGIILCLTTLFLSLFIFPTGLDLFIGNRAKSIMPVYKLEIEKLKILMDFEKKVIEGIGVFEMGEKVTDSRRDLILSYRRNEFKKIQALEEEMMSQMRENISLFHKLSSFFPTTFYLSLNNEISSRGYESLIDFYQCVLQLKREFFQMYLDKVYFSNYSEIESFVKEGNENIYQCRPRLPKYLPLGFAMNLFYIFILTFISYTQFKKSLLSLPRKKENVLEAKDVRLKKSQFREWEVDNDLFASQLYAYFANQSKALMKKGYSFKISMDEEIVLIQGKIEQLDFIYLLHPKKIPGDIKTKHYFHLVRGLMKVSKERGKEIIRLNELAPVMNKRIRDLNKIELGNLFLSLLDMKAFAIYVLNNCTTGMTVEFAIQLKELLEEFLYKGAVILLLYTGELHLTRAKEAVRIAHESKRWSKLIDGYIMSMDKKEG